MSADEATKIPVWELVCHDGTKLRFRFMNAEETNSLKELCHIPMGIVSRLTSGRMLTSQLRLDAYEEAKFWATQLGVGDAAIKVFTSFNTRAFEEDLVRFFWEGLRHWPWGDLTEEERSELKDFPLVKEYVDSDYTVVDELPDKQVLELGEGSRPTASHSTSGNTSPAGEDSSTGTTETGSESEIQEADWKPVGRELTPQDVKKLEADARRLGRLDGR